MQMRTTSRWHLTPDRMAVTDKPDDKCGDNVERTEQLRPAPGQHLIRPLKKSNRRFLQILKIEIHTTQLLHMSDFFPSLYTLLCQVSIVLPDLHVKPIQNSSDYLTPWLCVWDHTQRNFCYLTRSQSLSEISSLQMLEAWLFLLTFLSAALGRMCMHGNIKNKQVSRVTPANLWEPVLFGRMLVCLDAPGCGNSLWVCGRRGTIVGLLPRMLPFSQQISGASCFKMHTTLWKVQNVEVRTRLLSLMLFTWCTTLATRLLFAICEMGDTRLPCFSQSCAVCVGLHGVTVQTHYHFSKLGKTR